VIATLLDLLSIFRPNTLQILNFFQKMMKCSQDSCLRLATALLAEVGNPLQGKEIFARGAYYVVGCLLRPIVLFLLIVNKYIVDAGDFLVIFSQKI